ncbi:hypothetical protein DSCW_16710 [Desulfosarcina widdelii]|uniref:DUF4136 domain-containing protein n=1 Tax=Desulfosarcina widdelii TaxID=947919 RepID=A0A5K7Z713_9BACT|nr:DUF4136 domain-containing protein [Desulfosarcina widdelii]BBO74254.1 hypothetical protein DSCW_16710 [Desulfosarcina widdelii]
MRAFSIVIVLFLLSACTNVQVSQDYDPLSDLSRYGTWQWREAVQPQAGDIRIDNPLLDQRIRTAVSNNLENRGISRTSERPEIYLSYRLGVERKIESDTTHTTIGYGGYYHPWYGGIGTETSIRQYDESRLTIDIHKADTGQLLWRGVGTYRFRTYKTPQDAAAAMQKIVDKILIQFPPAN